MPEATPRHRPSASGWRGIRGGRRIRPGTVIAEALILAVSLTAIAMVFLILLFVGREALPILTGQLSSAAAPSSPRPELGDLQTLEPGRLRAYLGLTDAQYAGMDSEMLRELVAVREEAAGETSGDPDAAVNTLAWRYLIQPHQWADYDEPVHVWQPVSRVQKYNVIPLLVGTLKTTVVALLFAVPIAIAAAIHVSQFAHPRWRAWLKPGIEMLASIPSVVLGAFAALVLAGVLQSAFGYDYRLNACLAGLALGVASIPVIFSIAEEALTNVPRSYTQAALALGASRWHAAAGIVLPAALPGLVAAVILGFGRCIGETMVVLIASGNAALLSPSLLDPARTLTATIAAELGETVVGGHHYRMLFVVGTLLLLISFLTNTAAQSVLSRLRTRQQEGS